MCLCDVVAAHTTRGILDKDACDIDVSSGEQVSFGDIWRLLKIVDSWGGCLTSGSVIKDQAKVFQKEVNTRIA